MYSALGLRNLYYPDEIYQTVEAGHRLAFGYGVVSWEWRQGIRSYVFPFLLSLVMRATAWMGHGSSGYLFAIAVVMSALFASVVWFCYEWARRHAGSTAGLIAGSTAAVWFFLVFMGSKTFTEVVSADAFLPALLLGTGREDRFLRRRLVGSGVLCGAAVALRPQLLPTVLFAAGWMCWPDLRARLPAFAAGFVGILAVFGLVDAFTLGYPFASFIRYFRVNVTEGRSTLYGTEPWYFYAAELLDFCWPLLPLAILGIRRSPLLAYLVLILVASHSVLAHKEFRFVYAAIPLIVALFGVGCGEVSQWIERRGAAKVYAGPVFGAVVVLAVLMFSVFLGAGFKRWHVQSGVIRLTDRLSRTPQACAVAYYGYAWEFSPGYAHLHSKIPMYFYESPAELGSDAGSFNELLLPDSIHVEPQGFHRVQCLRDACLYERPGTCARSRHPEVNGMLEATNQ